MNYKELLEKYMAVVVMSEGTTFVDECSSKNGFNEEEVRELIRLREECRESFGAEPRKLTPEAITTECMWILGLQSK